MLSRLELPMNRLYKNLREATRLYGKLPASGRLANTRRHLNTNASELQRHAYKRDLCKNLMQSVNFEKGPTTDKDGRVHGGHKSLILSETSNSNALSQSVDTHPTCPLYKFTTYQGPMEIERDAVEVELTDFLDIQDPSHVLQVYTEINEELQKLKQQERTAPYDTSGPIMWNLVF